MLNSRRDKKRKTEEESPSLAVAGSWAARKKKSEAECPSLAIAGSWAADHSPNREWEQKIPNKKKSPKRRP